MKEFDNLIANAKISEIQDYRYFEKFAKQLNFKDLLEKDIETIKQLKKFIQTITIDNKTLENKIEEQEEIIKQLLEDFKKSDKTIVVDVTGDNKDEATKEITKLMMQIHPKFRKRIADILFKHRLQFKNYRRMIKELKTINIELEDKNKRQAGGINSLVELNNLRDTAGNDIKTFTQLLTEYRRLKDMYNISCEQFNSNQEHGKILFEQLKEQQEINKQLIEEKEKLSKQLIIQQTVNKQLTEQLIDQQTINTKLNIEIQGLRDKMEEQNRRLKYYQGKEIRREKEHQVCIDKIKELQEEIESFEKGSLAVKLNEVTKERNEAVFELSEEKQKNLTVINQMNKLKEELIESEENRDQLVEFNRNYQEDIRRLEEKNSNLYSNYHESCRETEELQKKMVENSVEHLQREEKLTKKKLEIIKEVLYL